jgi:hypothetical protein
MKHRNKIVYFNPPILSATSQSSPVCSRKRCSTKCSNKICSDFQVSQENTKNAQLTKPNFFISVHLYLFQWMAWHRERSIPQF